MSRTPFVNYFLNQQFQVERQQFPSILMPDGRTTEKAIVSLDIF
jgi:hypothetical protein